MLLGRLQTLDFGNLLSRPSDAPRLNRLPHAESGGGDEQQGDGISTTGLRQRTSGGRVIRVGRREIRSYGRRVLIACPGILRERRAG